MDPGIFGLQRRPLSAITGQKARPKPKKKEDRKPQPDPTTVTSRRG